MQTEEFFRCVSAVTAGDFPRSISHFADLAKTPLRRLRKQIVVYEREEKEKLSDALWLYSGFFVRARPKE